MYGKLFDSMYDGTLVEDWRALITFQQFIILCDADGTVDMTPSAISRRTGIPIEHIKAGIEILENADPYSRTPDEDGRRIAHIDEHRPWGWYIVNHNKYKKLIDSDTVRAQTRERVKKHRDKKKGVTDVTDGNAQKRHIDTDTNTDTEDQEKGKTKRRFTVQPQSVVDLYHKMLPELPKVVVLTKPRQANIRQRESDKTLENLKEWENYFDHVRQSRFLMGLIPASNGRSRPFTANFDFLIRQSTVVSTAEGKYHDGE